MRGHIRNRGKKSWAIVIDLGRDNSGKRRQKWHSVQGTKKDAERELAKLLHQRNSGTYVAPGKLSVRELLEQWLNIIRPNVAPKTFERYQEIVRLHLVPALGHHGLHRVEPSHIASYYAQAQQTGRRKGGGLSAQTVLHHHRVLHKALNTAVKHGLLGRNPSDAVEPPRPARKQAKALDETQAAALLEALKGTRYYAPSALALATGMRRGELLALTWPNVDLEKAEVMVCQSLEQTNAGVAVKSPKSGRGRRVALPDFAVESLRGHKTWQLEERLALGRAYTDHKLVFAREDGSPWPPDSFTSGFEAAVRRAGISHVNFHALRHSHATLLLKDGVNPKVVSERLGHAKVGTTLDIYAHVLPGMQEDAARRVDQLLRGSLGSPS
jgi:integrase